MLEELGPEENRYESFEPSRIMGCGKEVELGNVLFTKEGSDLLANSKN